MLVIPGCSAISPSRRKSIQENIQRTCPIIDSVDAVYLHLVKCVSSEGQEELTLKSSVPRRILDALLTYGDHHAYNSTLHALETLSGDLAYVLPRPGSISPWSSKATDISHICNLGGHIERIERCIVYSFQTKDGSAVSKSDLFSFYQYIHDRMIQFVDINLPVEEKLFMHHPPKPLRIIDLQNYRDDPKAILSVANKELGLALAQDEIEYLADAFVTGDHALNRNPTDAELFMFAQVNSEHCRHKIFNATWTIDGKGQDMSLFQMIRNTEKVNGADTLSAYSDNAAVFEGYMAPRFGIQSKIYASQEERMPILAKVETHNHPTAVSPYPGAATGSGGEIRDEGAVGRGSKPKAGLCGFTVSNLNIPGYEQPWEIDYGKPAHIASALDIMLDAPLGASAFNNEFGRPNLTGYFRTYSERISSESKSKGNEIRGYHKPIMIAGGLGHVRPAFVKKRKIDAGARIAVLGGPGMLIGLGGGAASSQTAGSSSLELDFASVQRDNAEMQRRCQQVIDACIDLGDTNPIQSIHDVGAGGLSNALPELVHDSELGARFEIRDVLVADTSMSPMEIWCNESQERYVLAIDPSLAVLFETLCRRERCPFSFVGVATEEDELIVTDRLLKQNIARLKMSTLFGKPPRMSRIDSTELTVPSPFDETLLTYMDGHSSLSERLRVAIERVLRLPTVGSKSFLVTIGDRSITGLVAREQMVGPWQVPVADVAVTRTTYGFNVMTGEAMAMGERPPVALLNPAASARVAVAESLTNLVAASIKGLAAVKLSANWMCAASEPGEGSGLYAAVKAIGLELCPALGIGIPVGKDSMSMSMKWGSGAAQTSVSSPLSVIITAFAPVEDISATWTPQLEADPDGETVLLLFDLSGGKTRLGGSALAQVFNQVGTEPPDVDDASTLKAFLEGCQIIHRSKSSIVLAYHDRSDGGLFTTLVEMCFAGRIGVDINLDAVPGCEKPLNALFSEELGAVMQVRKSDLEALQSTFARAGFPLSFIHAIGSVSRMADRTIRILHRSEAILTTETSALQKIWAEASYRLQALRDEPLGAREEYDLIDDPSHAGIFYDLTYVYEPSALWPTRPRIAILREQGVNGHAEMAWSFSEAGFDAIDVHMSDVISGSISLVDFRGLAACGGFSYGDVLGAGNGWANSVLFNQTARKEFEAFFQRTDTFSLAVCNGCQFYSHLRQIIPGTAMWPEFKPNKSERFEGRTSMVEIVDNEITANSVFLRGMGGSKLPVAVAHGEGRAVFYEETHREELIKNNQVAIRYVDSSGKATELYPLNPNGSPEGITGLHTPDGRILALMPHPERVTTLDSNSWYPHEMRQPWHGTGPWFRIFQNARAWCG